jgi:hypothetical protein
MNDHAQEGGRSFTFSENTIDGISRGLLAGRYGPDIKLVYNSHLSPPRLLTILPGTSQHDLKRGRSSSKSRTP